MTISLSSNQIRCLTITKTGTICIGNATSGVDFYRPLSNVFVHYPNVFDNGFRGEHIKGTTTSPNTIWTIHDQGLDQMDKTTQKVISNTKLKDADAIITFQKAIWVAKGTSIYIVNDDNTIIKEYQLPNQTINHKHVFQFIKDSKGQLWSMTGCGLLKYNELTDSFEEFIVHGTCKAWFFATYDAHRHRIWAGTYGYLVAFDLETKVFTDWTLEKGALPKPYDYNDPALDYYKVEDAKVDAEGTLWVITSDLGLVKIEIDPQGKSKPTFYGEKEGLVNKEAIGLLIDKENYLWVMTTRGLSRFDAQKEQFINFTQASGLPSNHHNRIAYCQDTAGTFYMGTNQGLYSFVPQLIGKKGNCPKVFLNAIMINNKSVKIGEHILDKDIRSATCIELEYTDQILSLGFSAMEHGFPNRIQYAYQLEGINQDWVYVNADERKAVYTSLPIGKHRFKVKASNYNGEFGATYTELFVIQHPPFWRSTTAYVLYILLLFFAIGSFIQWREYRLKKENIYLEKEVYLRTKKIQEDRKIILQQADELRALDRMKSRFFANISHEFRTPLTLILGPLNQLLKKTAAAEKIRPKLEMMEQNGQQLLGLINEILDLSKLEKSTLSVHNTAVQLDQFLRRIFFSFESGAAYKSIKLVYENKEAEGLRVLLDEKKVERILNNLLSNALKFSPSDSVIKLTIKSVDIEWLILEVEDNGVGIDEKDLPHIFNRFYQTANPNANASGGTGIGLALAKELAGLLGGTLTVESELSKGTSFYLRLPKNLAVTPKPSAERPVVAIIPKEEIKPIIVAVDPTTTILLVEDHPEMRTYTKDILEAYYTVLLAENGAEALDILSARTDVNLIVSDVMMPIMDGFELLNQLKASDMYRSIPVVMLTARVALEDKLRALRIGVDDYLTKPFVEDELLIRVSNLLQHYKARQIIEAPIETALVVNKNKPESAQATTERPVISEEDQTWLINLETIVQEHCGNNNFTVDWLAATLAISPRQLQRRLKKLTGLTPKKYLTEVRLQTARRFLENKKYNTINQVMYAVGFKKPAYFSKLFAERFGFKPSSLL